MPVYLLSQKLLFPPPDMANPDGLLAVGGDLSVARLLLAYRNGIFPWYNPQDPILWWSPDPRLVLFPKRLRVTKRLARLIRQGRFAVTLDQDFTNVIVQCAKTRLERGQDTWLSDQMIEAYIKLHRAGFAHSAEAWLDGKLAGGLYGVAMGRVFFGESMFSTVSNASKVAFVTLVRQLSRWDFRLIDCQVTTKHLLSFGAEEIPRREFLELLDVLLRAPTRASSPWHLEQQAPDL